MSVSLSLYIVLHFFVDLLCQIKLPLEKKKKKKLNINVYIQERSLILVVHVGKAFNQLGRSN